MMEFIMPNNEVRYLARLVAADIEKMLIEKDTRQIQPIDMTMGMEMASGIHERFTEALEIYRLLQDGWAGATQ